MARSFKNDKGAPGHGKRQCLKTDCNYNATAGAAVNGFVLSRDTFIQESRQDIRSEKTPVVASKKAHQWA